MSQHACGHAWYSCNRFQKDESSEPLSLIHNVRLVRRVTISGHKICSPSGKSYHVICCSICKTFRFTMGDFDLCELIFSGDRMFPCCRSGVNVSELKRNRKSIGLRSFDIFCLGGGREKFDSWCSTRGEVLLRDDAWWSEDLIAGPEPGWKDRLCQTSGSYSGDISRQWRGENCLGRIHCVFRSDWISGLKLSDEFMMVRWRYWYALSQWWGWRGRDGRWWA